MPRTLYERVRSEAFGSWVRTFGDQPNNDSRADEPDTTRWLDAGADNRLSIKHHRLVGVVLLVGTDADGRLLDITIGDYPHCNLPADYTAGAVAKLVGNFFAAAVMEGVA